MSRVTAIISALVICIIVRLSWAVNHYRDNAIYLQSPARQKCQRNRVGERGNYDMAQMRQRDVAALDAKIHEGVSWTSKLENDRDDAAAGRRRLHIKAVCQSVREVTTPPAWIMQPPDWQTLLN